MIENPEQLEVLRKSRLQMEVLETRWKDAVTAIKKYCAYGTIMVCAGDSGIFSITPENIDKVLGHLGCIDVE
jgi:hypothetical protein